MVEQTLWQTALRTENRANPYPFYAELRKTPVARQPDGTYVVSTYREVVRCSTTPGSARTYKRPGATRPGAALKVGATPNRQVVIEPNIITQDPPEHDRIAAG